MPVGSTGAAAIRIGARCAASVELVFDSLSALVTALPNSTDGLTSDALLSAITTAQELINAVTAAQLSLVAEFAHRRPAPEVALVAGGEQSGRGDGVSEFASTEIACVLRLTRRGSDLLLGTALELRRLPSTAAAFGAGKLDLRRVRVITEASLDLPDEAVAELEATVLPRAPEQTAPQLARTARRAALRLSPRTAQERHQAIVDARSLWLEHHGGGRSRLLAEGPTHEILQLFAAVDAVARHSASGEPDSSNAITQRRFDALGSFARTILDDPDRSRTARGAAGITLLADPSTLARLQADVPADPQERDSPVELLGDGPIHDALAVELLGDPRTAVIRRTLADDWTCDHTAGYQVPDRLARHLTGTRSRCVFPGCGVPSRRCDWDHVVPWPTGPTCACNLLPLCRYHHRLKTHTRWQLALHPDRHAAWTSPTGRTYVIHPDEETGHHCPRGDVAV